MTCNIIEIMWFFIAEFNINSVHIIACPGVFVNDLLLYHKKLSLCTKKDISKQTGFTKITMTGLKIMQFFRKICVCHIAF